MRRFIPTLLLLTLVAILAACGGGEGTKTPEDIHFGPQDTGPPPTPDARWDEPDTVEVVQPPDEKSEPDIPPVLTGCGDGECKGGETVENCAKDCLDTPEAAAFVFAHKGDELGALGRIYDLVQAGAPVYVFYLTFDDTPIDTIYAGAPSKLSVATLGVPAENIYLYETHIDWGLVTGSREVVDKLTQHFITLQPKTIYLPQLCGGELEDEMAHIAGIWAAKRAKIFPAYYEVPSPSNYYVGTAPDPATAQADPDAFVEQFVRRWKLIAKGTEELKPTLGSEDMVELRLAAAHIMNDWFQAFLYKLPEDRLLYLLREMQRFREVPAGQKSDKKPFTQSPPDCPSSTSPSPSPSCTTSTWSSISAPSPRSPIPSPSRSASAPPRTTSTTASRPTPSTSPRWRASRSPSPARPSRRSASTPTTSGPTPSWPPRTTTPPSTPRSPSTSRSPTSRSGTGTA
jgi:hypothetical protein